MKKTMTAICVLLLLLALPAAFAEEEDTKADKKRAKIDGQAKGMLAELRENENVEKLYGDAVGYAVFDNTKAALGISGGGGSGVAVNNESGARTYMKMGTGGIGLGIGVKKYQVLFLFQNTKAFDKFVDKGWQADTQAGAAAGTAAAGVAATFHNGVAVFINTEKGLMASADVSGTKYWKSKLNDE